MPRARDLGIEIGRLPTGPVNAITDVPGLAVGHTTLIEGDDVRTGVTVVVPPPEPLFAASHTINGNGELTGLEWIRDSGTLTTPIGLTNTHSVGVVRDALIAAAQPGEWDWSLPVVGETWDGFLNDINGFHVRPSTSRRHLPPRARGRSRRAPSAAAPAWSATASRAGSAPPRASSRTAGRSACSCRRTTAAGLGCG